MSDAGADVVLIALFMKAQFLKIILFFLFLFKFTFYFQTSYLSFFIRGRCFS